MRARCGLLLVAWIVIAACGRDGGGVADREPDYYIHDDIVGHVHRPNAAREFEWPEHPVRRVAMRTNNLGFREDADTEWAKPAGTIRVLITGDSHIDGVISNIESFPNRLEDKLNSSGLGRYEVINGGTGYYGPGHYARFAERYRELNADIFVATLYSGNDFLDAARELEAAGEIAPKRTDDYRERLGRANEALPGGVGQSLNQAFFFARHPECVEPVIAFTKRMFDRLCDERLIVVLLPTLADAEPTLDAERIAAAADALGLGREALAQHHRMTDAVREHLRTHDVPIVDLFGRLHHPHGRVFWRRDHHLSSWGHATVADALLQAIRPVASARRP